MGPLLRELGPWISTLRDQALSSRECRQVYLDENIGPGDLCRQAPTGDVVPRLSSTLRSCCSHWDSTRRAQMRQLPLPKEGKSWAPLSTNEQNERTQGSSLGLGRASHMCSFNGPGPCEAEGCSWSGCPATGAADSFASRQFLDSAIAW